MNEMEQLQQMPEILAPAGTFEALKAAVAAKADAVYLGGALFGARAFAGNFEREELIEAICYCHLFDMNVYLTVNTLLKEAEIDQLEDYLRPFYEVGVDSVLVQDIGVAGLLHEKFPDLPLHASTQMSVSSQYGAGFLKTIGFTRIVPARELSLEEIKAIKEKSGMEIETFVHGAMCFAYSGKCLFSSFLGGRSGNRGRCAQPCRQCYEVSGALVRSEYALSLKDLCTLSILPDLIEAGIDSFKIEGRMKNPDYVYAVTASYVRARDLYYKLKEQENATFTNWKKEAKTEYQTAAEHLQKQLQDIYNRGGFCTGYYHIEKGTEMAASTRPNHEGLRIGTVEKVAGPELFIRLEEEVHPGDILEVRRKNTGKKTNGQEPGGYAGCIAELTCNQSEKAGAFVRLKGKHLKQIKNGMPVFRTKNQALLSGIEEERKKERTVAVRAFVRAVEAEPLTLILEEANAPLQHARTRVSVQGSPVQPAGTSPVTKEQLTEKLQKTGGSHLAIAPFVELGKNVFFSMGEFNRLRRQAADLFKQAKAETRFRTK